MKAQSLANNTVNIRKAVDEIVVCWISRAFVHLFAESLLGLRVARKLDDNPLREEALEPNVCLVFGQITNSKNNWIEKESTKCDIESMYLRYTLLVVSYPPRIRSFIFEETRFQRRNKATENRATHLVHNFLLC